MKNNGIVVASAIILFLTVTAFIAGGKSSPSSPAPKGIPDSVFAIFDNSCTDCHSDDGNGMAKAHVNFDKWDTYTADKQASKAQDIVKEMQKGAMPPGGFRKNNPDRVPTDAQVALVSNWAKAYRP